jgi:hypothetical protein
MAARKTNKTTLDSIVSAIAAILAQTGKDATTVSAVAAHMGTTQADIMTTWNTEDPDDAVISGERGEMWLTESDDETPDVTVDTTPETPVESLESDNTPDNDNEDETMDNANTEPETTVIGSWVNEGEPTHFTDYVAGQPVTGHTLLPEPEFIPAPPEGVNPNTWELSKTAATINGRIFWGKRVREQMDAHAAAVKAAEDVKAQEVTETPAVEWTAPIDPVTGQPFSL